MFVIWCVARYNFIISESESVSVVSEEFKSIGDVIDKNALYDIYLVHDNGGRPFRVIIDEENKNAIISIHNYYDDDEMRIMVTIIIISTTEKFIL